MPEIDFGPDFFFGTATSSFQIEGRSPGIPQGDSIWDTFCAEPGRIADASDGLVACDPALGETLLGGAAPGIEMPDFMSDMASAEIGLVAVQEDDGRWYVSPTETLGDTMLQGLRIWDRETIQQYIDWLIEFGGEAGSAALF